MRKALGMMWVIAITATLGHAQTVPPVGTTTGHSAAPVRHLPPPRDWWGHGKKKQGFYRKDTGKYNNALGLPLLKHIAGDQKSIWTSPFHLRLRDANWLVPLGGLAASLLVTDSATSRSLTTSPTRISQSRTFSNMGIASLIGAAGGLYLLGKMRHNKHMTETGLLSGEAVIDSYLAATAIKTAAGRERPYVDNAQGLFRQGGNSFPSEHATAAWSTAGILAHEYPGPLTKLFAYGLASAISASRVTGQEHFPSDILIGSVLGYLISQHVYHAHHNPQIWGDGWQLPFHDKDLDRSRLPEDMGSPYVPLDSWVYPAFKRLAALGYVQSEMLGMRPWTRLECARLVEEASDRLSAQETDPPMATSLIHSLQREFASDLNLLAGGRNRSIVLKSVYTRITGISGQPLTDGNHFGQTITNDFGRPYGEGFNDVTGFSGWASAGPFTAYLRGEYQHAPASPALPLMARQFISNVDSVPLPPSVLSPSVDRFRALDAYVAMNFENWQVSFGKQSLWWGPGEGGPLMFSDNAEPITMLRISRVSPFKLPWILGWLGPMRVEWFLGQLAGHQFVFRTDTGLVGQWGTPIGRQPFIQGQKLSFKPTRNFEFGVSTTTVFSGGPTPLTWHYFLKSYSINNGSNTQQGSLSDPGDRRSGVDFSYRVPGLRNWLTFYGDAFTEDEFSPLGYPRKSAFQGGIYMPRIPGIPKLDLRVEGGSTSPPDFPGCVGCFYVNNRYPDGSYTNRGNLMGSWLGRAGQGQQAWSTYWFTPRNKIQFYFRHFKVDGQYLPSGGTLNDGGVRADFWLNSTLSLSGTVQYEKWNFPLLAPVPKSDVTTSIEVSFWPRHWDFLAHR